MVGSYSKNPVGRPKSKNGPLGRQKIIDALKSLLKTKGFQEITWGEIARKAGVSEALIYQYFKTRNGLLYFVLAEYLKEYKQVIWAECDETKGALNKLRVLIHGLLSVYNDNRVFARILLLEVRNFKDYFDSEAYALVREMGVKFLVTIEDGIREGAIRSDIPAARMRQTLLGGVEHAILPYVIFQKQADIETIAHELAILMVDAVKRR